MSSTNIGPYEYLNEIMLTRDGCCCVGPSLHGCGGYACNNPHAREARELQERLETDKAIRIALAVKAAIEGDVNDKHSSI